MLNTRDRTIMSFTVFAMFFGAGNLIFPVFLAYSSGTAVIPAFAGFALSSIGLPVLSLIAIGSDFQPDILNCDLPRDRPMSGNTTYSEHEL